MLLSDRDLLTEYRTGRLGIEPFDQKLLQPASIDVRLDRRFRVFPDTTYNHISTMFYQDQLTIPVEPEVGFPFSLNPGEFALGSTVERFTFPGDLAGRIEGKSSLGRLGLLVHSTAGFIDPGFEGTLTLELANTTRLPITLLPGMRIGQVCVLRLSSPALNPYGSPCLGSRYQGQDGPTESRAYQGFDVRSRPPHHQEPHSSR